LATAVVVLPSLGNLHYRAAYSAYQEYRWTTAVEELDHASCWEPLNAKYHQLRAEALINLGRYEEATSTYQRAVRLKRDFAPYHAQLGWLFWLQDDPETAKVHFQSAIEADPYEAWRDGLHADLGLVYAAQGYTEEAISLLKETIELDPKLALAPYWIPDQGADGGLDVILDPVYLSGPSSELDKRMLAHLGKADHTSRLFDQSTMDSPLSFNQVLDAVEADYLAARVAGGREAPRLLATVAEAARLVGLYGRAERAYLAYQEAFPESAYGYRDLGNLYREQGRLDRAQEMLEQAVQVSPRDTASWLGLAEVYLERGFWEEAQEALDTIYRLKPLDVRLYELRAQLHRQTGEVAQAANALQKALVIEESISNRLALADLYRQLGEVHQGVEQCIDAAEFLMRTWPHPLDPNLREIGVCLAHSTEDDLPREIVTLASKHPLVGGVLVGHAYRARGQLEPALDAYQAAASARPDEGAPHYFLGETYQALGQPDSAAAEYRQAAALDPLESLPLLALGQMQWAQGQQEAALETFRAAVSATPGWGQAHVALGNALLTLGDRESAERHYQLAQTADGGVRENLVYDFSARLASAEIEAPGPDYVRNDYFTIDGIKRRVMFMHPEALARYAVEVPAGGLLAFQVAIAPESWEQPGDGVGFAVYVESGGAATQVFSSYIDPKQDEDARRWHPHTVDLSDYAGQTISVIFETRPGPAGDLRYDWAGWGEARLLAP
jgi:tetratricopeptide (TPR) repeat protein